MILVINFLQVQWDSTDHIAIFLQSKSLFAGMIEGDIAGQFGEIYHCKKFTHVNALRFYVFPTSFCFVLSIRLAISTICYQ